MGNDTSWLMQDTVRTCCSEVTVQPEAAGVSGLSKPL